MPVKQADTGSAGLERIFGCCCFRPCFMITGTLCCGHCERSAAVCLYSWKIIDNAKEIPNTLR